MNVPVDDRDSRAAACACVRSRDCNVVEQTEAHGGAWPRVVPRRSNERDAVFRLTVEQRIDHRDAPARRPNRRGMGRRRIISVGVQISLPSGDARQFLHVSWLVDAAELVFGGVSCRELG